MCYPQYHSTYEWVDDSIRYFCRTHFLFRAVLSSFFSYMHIFFISAVELREQHFPSHDSSVWRRFFRPEANRKIPMGTRCSKYDDTITQPMINMSLELSPRKKNIYIQRQMKLLKIKKNVERFNREIPLLREKQSHFRF